MKQLDHPYVLKLLYCFQTPDYMHMVMELCEHGDLSMQLDMHQYFDEQLARFIAAELVLAMDKTRMSGVRDTHQEWSDVHHIHKNKSVANEILQFPNQSNSPNPRGRSPTWSGRSPTCFFSVPDEM